MFIILYFSFIFICYELQHWFCVKSDQNFYFFRSLFPPFFKMLFPIGCLYINTNEFQSYNYQAEYITVLLLNISLVYSPLKMYEHSQFHCYVHWKLNAIRYFHRKCLCIVYTKWCGGNFPKLIVIVYKKMFIARN